MLISICRQLYSNNKRKPINLNDLEGTKLETVHIYVYYLI